MVTCGSRSLCKYFDRDGQHEVFVIIYSDCSNIMMWNSLRLISMTRLATLSVGPSDIGLKLLAA